MTRPRSLRRIGSLAAALIAAAALGWVVATWTSRHAASPSDAGAGPTAAPARAAPKSPARVDAPQPEKKVLYWYDPMVPQQHFDKPGKSPFMDMQLVPKYAETDDAGPAGVAIAPSVSANLGVRFAKVAARKFEATLEVPAQIGYDDRDVSIVQTRTAGFVERAWPLAVGDVVSAGAPLVELLVPDWTAAQYEYIALLDAREPELARAARDRLLLAGMPSALVERVERDRKPHARVTIASPRAGVVQELGVRNGMTLPAGATVARVGGIAHVWVEAAVPETLATQVRVGAPAEVRTAAASDPIAARVSAVLPETNKEARTLRVRVEVTNTGGRLRPGQLARVRLSPDSREALAVPSEAVIRDGSRSVVIVSSQGGRFVPTTVAVGEEAGGFTEILSGLGEGQSVVASGQFLIDSEANLKGVLSRMQPEETSK